MHPPDDLVLDRYLAGDANPAERRMVDEWLAADVANAAFLRELQAALAQPQPAMDVDRHWQALNRRLHPAGRRWRPTLVLPLAAAAALLLWSVWRQADAERMVQLVAAAGVQESATLPDGSTIVLAPGGRAEWPVANRDARQVRLEGEAYFTVVHDTRPFRVRAGGAVVQDLGTRFTVRALASDSMVAVAVEEGEVAVGDSTRDPVASGVRLTAGQAATVDRRGQVSPSGNAIDALAWVHGELVWSGTPLPDVARTIERWYNVELRVDAALAGRRVTARLQRGPIEVVLQSVAAGVGAQITGGNGRWTIAGDPR